MLGKSFWQKRFEYQQEWRKLIYGIKSKNIVYMIVQVNYGWTTLLVARKQKNFVKMMSN